MSPHKCPCCDGYGKRLDPASNTGVACVSCGGTGVVWGLSSQPPAASPSPLAPMPMLVPYAPYEPSTTSPRAWWGVVPPSGVFG